MRFECIDPEQCREIIEGEEVKPAENAAEGNVSMSERRKRDRLREKELLSKVK